MRFILLICVGDSEESRIPGLELGLEYPAQDARPGLEHEVGSLHDTCEHWYPGLATHADTRMTA